MANITPKPIEVAPFAEIHTCPNTTSRSLYATVSFKPGEIISPFGAREVLDCPNYLTVQISNHQHILLDPEFLQYINHSCAPNVHFDLTNRVVTALQSIEAGEEMTFFYPSTEWSMAQGFDCHCQDKNCLGYIQGAAHLPIKTLQNYQVSRYIQEKIANS